MTAAGTIIDEGIRREALDIGRSFIVQAPAGSGKTELLIQRLLALLASVNRPEEILAITFTRKAAAEMRGRLLEALEGSSQNPPSAEHSRFTWELARQVKQRDEELQWQLLDNPARLNIQTIDSFCASLVRRMPWVSRFGGMPQVAEDPRELYREAADRLLARAGSTKRGGAEVMRLLRHLDNRMERLRQMLMAMLQRRDQWLRHIAVSDAKAQRSPLQGALAGLIEDALREAEASLSQDCRLQLVELGRFAAENLSADNSRPIKALAGMERFPAPTVEKLAYWKGLADLLLTSNGTFRRKVDVRCGFPASGDADCRDLKRSMEQLLARLPESSARRWQLVASLPSATYADDRWDILEDLIELLPLAVAELWLVFREESRVDFAEIALKALQSLGHAAMPSDLLLQLDAGIRHILVDEFQDTSCLQYELLEKLTAGWSPEDRRTLFLVGDPMQSIYRFREAEVGLFLHARQSGLGNVSLNSLELKSNFRSQHEIVTWVNQSFRRIFPASEDVATGAIPYAEATAVRPTLDGPAVTVHPFSERDDLAEAKRVGDLVESHLADHPDEELAILVRSRTHLPEILRQLRKRGVRYQAQDIDLLANRPAARDIVSLTRALLHPGDRLSWLAVLRAPWCGLTLCDLLIVGEGTADRTVIEMLLDHNSLVRLDAGARHRAEKTGKVLHAALGQKGRVDLRRLVEGSWLQLGGPTCYDAGGLDDAAAVFELLEQLDQGGDLKSFEAFDEAMESFFAPADATADGRVQVMTIHRAKGLEFDSVVIPGLGRSPSRTDRHLLRWLEHPDHGLLLAPIAPLGGEQRDEIYDAIGRLEAEKEKFESVRLLYVAVTRAKSRIHLLGHAGLNRKGEQVPASGSLLEKLWPAIAESYVEGSKGGGNSDHPPAEALMLSRLPDEWSPPQLLNADMFRGAEIRKPAELGDHLADVPLVGWWTRETSRHVGTVIHFWLEKFASPGVDISSQESAQIGRITLERQLLRLGVAPGRLQEAVDKVQRALQRTLKSAKGRWLLQSQREGACEMSVSGVVDGCMVHAVIDRTFVDDQGVRWIVDYKSGEEDPEDKEAFLAAQEERYRGQVHLYAALFRALEPDREIRAGLYFPLLDWWREIVIPPPSD